MKKLPLLLLAVLPILLQAQATTTHPIPQWLLDDWTVQTAGSGVWITDNSAYHSDAEPFEAYGIHWEWGLGKKSLKGRLFGIKDGKDVGSFWQFLSFWDPAKGEVRLIQIAGDGTIGEGISWKLDDGSSKSRQVFTSPGGGSFESGHHEWPENGASHTQSYDIVNEEWVKRRFYVWKPAEVLPEKASGK